MRTWNTEPSIASEVVTLSAYMSVHVAISSFVLIISRYWLYWYFRDVGVSKLTPVRTMSIMSNVLMSMSDCFFVSSASFLVSNTMSGCVRSADVMRLLLNAF